MKAGLQPTKPDSRDLQLGAITKLPDLSELPKEFSLTPLGVKDQGETDFCSAFSSCSASEMQEGIELEPSWSFMASKKISKDVQAWGQNIRDALKAHIEYGALPRKDSPYSLETHAEHDLRREEFWPTELFKKAMFQKKKAYVKVTGPYDHYDNIRATLWKFRNENRAVLIGLVWSWPIVKIKLKGASKNGFGHMVCLIGWNEDGIILLNSAGPNAGKGGLHYVERETINYFVEQYGAYMFIDKSKEEVQYMIDNGITLENNWFIAIMKALSKLFF